MTDDSFKSFVQAALPDSDPYKSMITSLNNFEKYIKGPDGKPMVVTSGTLIDAVKCEYRKLKVKKKDEKWLRLNVCEKRGRWLVMEVVEVEVEVEKEKGKGMVVMIKVERRTQRRIRDQQ
jgi:hypothetical protein